jgi:predicted N-acetyltransferase YhbS
MDDCRNSADAVSATGVLEAVEPYYSRFGFTRNLVVDLHLPGPVDRNRFLGVELAPGSLDGAEELVMASMRLHLLLML